MFLLTSTDDAVLTPIEDSWICEAILIFEGECTCCDRRHEGMPRCDKEVLRDTALGLYAELLHGQRQSHLVASLEQTAVIATIEAQKERVFPRTITGIFPSKS